MHSRNDADDPVALHEDVAPWSGNLDWKATFPNLPGTPTGSRWDGRLQMRSKQEKVPDDRG
jgi:hypothetical protein